jgi:hypothetical protein
MSLGAIAPALIGGLLSVGGQAMTISSQNKQAEEAAQARNQVLQQTLKKNDAIAADSRNLFNERRAEVEPEPMAEAQEEATADRTATLDASVQAAPEEMSGLSGSAPQVVQSELAKRMMGAVEKGKTEAQQLGKVGGYGDTWFNQGIANVDTSRNLGVNQNFASGNMALLPYGQDLAEQAAYKPISPFGSILSGLGSAFGSASGGGFFTPSSYKPGY